MAVAHRTPAGFHLGYVPDAVDTRDHLFAAAAPGASTYRFVDLAKNHKATPAIWDQGQLGSCTAHGTAAAIYWAEVIAGLVPTLLSRLQLYFDARALEGTTDQDAGAQIRDAIKAGADGTAPEVDWPYDISRFAEQPPAKARRDASHKALTYDRVPVTTAGIQAALTAGFPIVTGQSLYASFESDKALSTGLAPSPTRADLVQGSIGGHCMAAWGIGTGADWHADGQFLRAKLSPHGLYLKHRQSWSADVYEDGYLLQPVTAVTKYGSDFWVVRTAS